MNYDILYQPSYSLARVNLGAGESMVAEAGAMVSHSTGITIDTGMKGGLFGALKKSVLGGESFFMNTFTAETAGEITFAPPLPGDINAMRLDGNTLFAQSGAFLAGEAGIDVDTQFSGAKTFFSREGLFLLKMQGHGTVFLSSFGAIHQITLAQGESYVVDTGHIVAFDASVHFNVRRVGGLKSTLLSGEGLVCDYHGPGRIWMQTRSSDAFLTWLKPKVRGQSSE